MWVNLILGIVIYLGFVAFRGMKGFEFYHARLVRPLSLGGSGGLSPSELSSIPAAVALVGTSGLAQFFPQRTDLHACRHLAARSCCRRCRASRRS